MDDGAIHLDVLGGAAGRFRAPGRNRQLTLRHTEILLALAAHPGGVTADELAVLVYAEATPTVTIRAEIHRLRRAVGHVIADSHPYQLAEELTIDADGVRTKLAAGDLTNALAGYRGPLLPRSISPWVADKRDILEAELRAAVGCTEDPDALERWLARNPDDYAAWLQLEKVSAPGSPARIRARARLDLLDRTLG